MLIYIGCLRLGKFPLLVGRVTGNTGIFLFGLTTTKTPYIKIITPNHRLLALL